MVKGTLFLLPNVLDDSQSLLEKLPPEIAPLVAELQGLIAESEKSARRYLRQFVSHDQMAKTPLRLLNEHTPSQDLASLLEPMKRGEKWGLISDAGLPCIADPGAPLVALAHQYGIEVKTFAGPSSILMALQLSGFSGQSFAFHGYLPREEKELTAKLIELEKRAGEATQIWIEAPYRSLKMLEFLKQSLHPTTRLCVAASLTMPQQKLVSLPVSKWRTYSLALEKEPAVFLISSQK